jgi:hypothetical protein
MSTHILFQVQPLSLPLLMFKMLHLFPLPPGKTSEVNVVQSTLTGKNKSKKGRGKNKERKNNNQNEQTKIPPIEDQDKRKPRYPCLICGDDHYMKDCPR